MVKWRKQLYEPITYHALRHHNPIPPIIIAPTTSATPNANAACHQYRPWTRRTVAASQVGGEAIGANLGCNGDKGQNIYPWSQWRSPPPNRDPEMGNTGMPPAPNPAQNQPPRTPKLSIGVVKMGVYHVKVDAQTGAVSDVQIIQRLQPSCAYSTVECQMATLPMSNVILRMAVLSRYSLFIEQYFRVSPKSGNEVLLVEWRIRADSLIDSLEEEAYAVDWRPKDGRSDFDPQKSNRMMWFCWIWACQKLTAWAC